jgi:hypothetical protein
MANHFAYQDLWMIVKEMEMVAHCMQEATAATALEVAEMPPDEAELPQSHHPDRIANHNILVALLSPFPVEETAVHHFPQFSLSVLILRREEKRHC